MKRYGTVSLLVRAALVTAIVVMGLPASPALGQSATNRGPRVTATPSTPGSTPTATASPTPKSRASATASVTSTATTAISTATSTVTAAATTSATTSPSGTATPFGTRTPAGTASSTPTPVGTASATVTVTPTVATSGTATATATVVTGTTQSFPVAPGQAKRLEFDGATIDLGAKAVTKAMAIGITALAEEDLPALDHGMANVTEGPRRGYRFQPHNTRFGSNITISLPYDPALIPEGLTEDDLRTFYFDDELGRWQELERVAVDTRRRLVVSQSDHFTDMINAAVTVPDHAQPLSYDPNTIKGIKAADPSAGLTLIEPPIAASTGDARLSYPIDVPPGRMGMQPRLQIGYSSSGGNGWLGMGWDIAVPAIGIDTRWGVPRYDASLETETYELSGQQLAPVAHRTAPQPRSAEKVFRTRVETAFQRIVRHGSGPGNYWWEVTEKDGIRSYFGGTPATGADPSATLRDDAGNVFRWALAEMRDPNGNGMRFTYDHVSDTGIVGGSVMGRQLYLRTINYTQSQGAEGAYSVIFHRDSQLPGYVRRPDVQIDARGGFKQVTAELLKRIEVTFNGQPVRSYDLSYQEGAFQRTLLKSITQRGADGSALPPHELTYFDDTRMSPAAYRGFGSPETWNTGADSVNWTTSTGSPADKLAGPLGQFLGFGGASALSGAVSDSVGGHLYVGFNPFSPTKQGSVGGKVGFGFSDSDTLLLLLDLDGDNLPDKVFKNSAGAPYVRLNRSGPGGTTTFGPPIPLPSLPDLSEESSMTWSFGAEAYLALNGLVNDAESFTTASVYFNDVNGDGLPDLVRGGTVLFNRLENGVPTFSASSSDTAVPIGPLSVDGTGLVDDLAPVYEAAIDNFPLVDTVRRWVAPFSGTISVTGTFNLVQDASAERAQHRTADGVRVAIQHNASELFARTIAADDYDTKAPTGVGSVSVNAGDRIYFRVGSVFDGAFDRLAWDPVIEYTGVTPGTDVNGLAVYRYHASRDFTLAGRRGISVQAPFTGTVRLTGALQKRGITTDSVTLLVLKNGAPAFSDTKDGSFIGDFALPPTFDVTRDDSITLRVRVDSPIDVSQLQWSPQLFYTAVTDPAGTPVQDGQGAYLIHLNPPYDIDLYPVSELTEPQAAYVAQQPGVLTVETQLVAADSQVNGAVTFTVKRPGALVAKRTIEITNGAATNASVSVSVAQGDVLYFDYASLDPALRGKLINKTVLASYGTLGTDPTFQVPSDFHSSASNGLFPQDYRGWAYAGYNGNRARATQPIDETDLRIEFNQQSSYDPRTARAYVFYPVPGRSVWRGPDDLTFAGPGYASSSRLGLDSIAVPTAGSVAGAQAVSRLSRTNQRAVGFGASAGPLSATGSSSSGTSHNQLDSLDVNGDGFPDIVGNGRIQFTTPMGGLEPKNRAVAGVGRVRGGDNSAKNLGVGGSAAHSLADADGTVDTTGNGAPRGEKTGSQMVTLGLSGSLGVGSSSERFDLMDVNGDGLPDLVAKLGGGVSCGVSLCAALNLGYGFAAFEPWGTVPVADGASLSMSLGTSLGFNGGLYDFAGGFSLSRNVSHGGCDSVDLLGACGDAAPLLVDINGDGLLDRARPNGGVLRVSFNTGNGFGPEATWSGALADGVARTANTGIGGGAYFTIGVPVCLVACHIIINPGADVARNLSRTEAVIRDVDGDGYPDHLVSSADGALTVARNHTGRTNLLKAIQRPLGARIEIDYTRSGNTRDLPQSRWVLSQISVHDGFAGDGADTQLTTLRYADGRYDRLEREFYGFGRVTEARRDTAQGGSVYRIVEHEFLTDSYYTKGLPKRRFTRDGAGRPFTEIEFSYRFRDANAPPGSEPADPSALLRSTVLPVFPELARRDQRYYEGAQSARKSTFETSEYDAFGNVSMSVQGGDDQTADDDVRATLEYSACGTSHITGKPVKITVAGPGGTILRHREATIDCATGNVTQVRERVSSSAEAVTDLGYFANGTLQHVTGPANGDGQRYALSFEYDPEVRTHVANVMDSFGYSSSAAYDARFGRPSVHVDTNNNKTSYAYDGFGRLSNVTGPYEQGGAVPTIRFTYHPDAAVPWALSRHFDRYRDATGSDTIDTATFVDGLARVVQTKRDATIHAGPDTSPQDVMRVSGRVTFDAFGRVVEERYPVTETLGTPGTINPATDAVAPTRTEHDVLDRPTKVTLPDGTFTTTAYGFGPDRSGVTQFELTVTDANGVQQKSYRDTRNVVTGIKRFNDGGSQTIWTSYRYDPMQQLIEARDDRNNVTRLAYDLLGRRTTIDSPDSGKTEVVYDLASNVVARITATLRAEGEQITYDYDFNRLTGITYPNFPANNVTYAYGTPPAPGASDPFNRAGRITSVTDQSGTEERFYGKLGETTKEIKTVAGPTGAGPHTYVTEYVYDTFGRLQQLTYPDGEVLTYRYDAGGAMRSATGQKGAFTYEYMKRIEYDRFDQRAFVETGNGVRTQYAYDPLTRRLANLKSGAPGSGPFQNLLYTYDNVGNVTGLANEVPVPGPSAFGGPMRQTFEYDDLDRLVKSAGTYEYAPGKLNRYGMGLAYDTIDNILTKTQTNDVVQPSGVAVPQQQSTYSFSFAYAGSQPHAATHIGDRTFSYDANGNEAGWTNDLNGTRRTTVWDDENRVQSIFENGHELRYVYDDRGERVIKRGPQGETVYVNEYFTIRNGTVGTKHVYAGAARMVSKLVKHSAEEKDRYFYHPDHLGSSNYVTSANGSLYEHLEYFPFGETWVQEKSNTQRTPYLYTAKELDEETGLYYFGARYYDPRTSQFISTDPLLQTDPGKVTSAPQVLALYSYGRNNPLLYVDPDGRDVIIAVGRDGNITKQGILNRTATRLQGNLQSVPGLKGVKIHVVDVSKIEATRDKILAAGGKVSTAIYVGHGTDGYMIPSKGQKLTVGDFADRAGLDEQGTVIAAACNVLEKIDTKWLKSGTRVYASKGFAYFGTGGELDTSIEDMTDPRKIGEFTKGKQPGDLRLSGAAGRSDPIEQKEYDDDGPTPGSLSRRVLQAEQRLQEQQKQATQQKQQERGR